MPCYSSSEPNYTECVLITALGPALSYLESNALYPEAENAIMTVVSKPRKGAEQEGEGQESRGLTDEAWGKLDDASKPSVEIIVPEMLGQLRGWKQYEETNVAPHPDCQDAAHSETKTASELEKTESAANDINPCNEQDKSGGRELAWR